MAYIGARYPVSAPVTSYTPGTAPVYGSGEVMDTLVAVNLNMVTSNNRDYGDDVVQAVDAGVNGYNFTVETNDLEFDKKAKILNWGARSGSATERVITAAQAQERGFGFFAVKSKGGNTYYEAYWMIRCVMSMPSAAFNTRQESTAFGHVSLNGEGLGTYDGLDEPSFIEVNQFETESAAKTWLNSKANIT